MIMNAKKEWTLTEDMMRGQFRDASTEWAGKAWERYGHSGESFESVGELKRYLTSKGFTDIKESGKGFTAKKDGYEWTIEYSTFANTKSGAKSITGVMTHKGRKIKDPSEKSGLKKLFGKDAEWGVYEPGELVKIEKRRDALWRKEDDGSLTAAEKSELADLQKKLAKHYAKLKADRKRAGFKDAKDPKQMTEKEIIEEIRIVQGKDIERSHALRQELDRRWAAGEKAHGIKGGFGKDEMSIVADMMNGKFAKDAIPMSAVSVRGEDRYAFTIGHKPSGNGHWCFRIGDKEFWVTGYYMDAKKAAIREAARLGEYSVTVLP